MKKLKRLKLLEYKGNINLLNDNEMKHIIGGNHTQWVCYGTGMPNNVNEWGYTGVDFSINVSTESSDMESAWYSAKQAGVSKLNYGFGTSDFNFNNVYITKCMPASHYV